MLLRRVIGVGLMADGVWSAVRMASLLSTIAGREPVDVATIAARLVAAACALTAGWQVSQNRPAGPWLAMWSAVATAAVTALGLGLGWLPTSIDPGLRRPVIVMYALAAVGVCVWARPRMTAGSE